MVLVALPLFSWVPPGGGETLVNTHGRACFVGGSQQRWKSNALSFVGVVVCRFLDFDIDGGLSGQNAPSSKRECIYQCGFPLLFCWITGRQVSNRFFKTCVSFTLSKPLIFDKLPILESDQAWQITIWLSAVEDPEDKTCHWASAIATSTNWQQCPAAWARLMKPG